jgi:hypothetical protein
MNELNESIKNAVVRQMLIDSVIRQILRDVNAHDFTAIDELLKHVPDQYLQGFLSERSV